MTTEGMDEQVGKQMDRQINDVLWSEGGRCVTHRKLQKRADSAIEEYKISIVRYKCVSGGEIGSEMHRLEITNNMRALSYYSNVHDQEATTL